MEWETIAAHGYSSFHFLPWLLDTIAIYFRLYFKKKNSNVNIEVLIKYYFNPHCLEKNILGQKRDV